MSKESLEHLSSLMDGELSRETGLFMTRRLSSDGELCGTWQRYHLIRDCIRQPGGRSTFLDFTACVRSALEQEETGRGSAWAGRSWLRPAAGFAVAASVALMAIVAIGPDAGSGNPVTDPANRTASQSFDSPNPLTAVPISPQPVSFNASDSRRLNSYLLRHNQLARSAGRQGFVSFVPMIATETDEQGQAATGTPGEAGDFTPTDPQQP
ncbi:MAG: hypothetical protein GWM87_13715 [Xanthomonadales bacterium]|nr:sigma-E factor negative regulatory protein [Xanthomonadales bacterium]NIX13872.1 hypothetical protein [Xanthomonadales bacterium]